ncbi:DUF2298 domain-containing protein [Halorussus halophilus]|uniref:DUF2298 domain-containing protein n=1 Tax=Halorussus halophilus TaxID=2650975 RepID=UPI001CE45DFC|nr:DUF2298 domain-containing protein [Halorussus halophilus]
MFIGSSLVYHAMEYALVLLWFLAFQVLALVGLPLAARLFPRFPDRGAAFALPVTLVLVGTVYYWVGHVAFSRATAFASVAVVAALSLFLIWSDRTFLPDEASDDTAESDDIEFSPRAYAETTTVFALAFCLLVAIRSVDPAVNAPGGEKFLDYGIFTSLLRAEALPPQDMWFAGEHLLYYYGGHFLSATLAQLTGTDPRFAYNLALSGFYATLVTAAYGLAGALADARGASHRVGGALGGFFVGLGGNLVVAVTGLIWLLPDSLASGLANWVAATLSEAHSGELIREGLSEFGYWAPSRVIPQTINEFPIFAFLNGDLHAHMLSTPFLLLVAALGFAYYQTPPEALTRRRLLAFGAIPPTVGLLSFVNVWSLPTGLGVFWLAVLFAPADPLSLFPGVSGTKTETPVTDGGAPATVLRAEGRRIVGAFAAAAAVAALAVAVIAPFIFGILLQSASSRSIAFFPKPSSAVALLMVHGVFLVIFTLFLWPRARETLNVRPARFALLAALLAVVAWVVDFAVLALVVPLLVVGWLLLRTDADCGYETVLLVGGAGLVTLVELVYIHDNAAGGRMNTVFKVYMQVWVLWGVAAGGALATLVSRTGPAEWTIPSLGLTRSDLMAALAVVLVASSSGFAGLALTEHFTSDSPIHRTDDPTLDSTAFVETFHPHEGEAIDYIQEQADGGQPHIVSPPGLSPYSWSSPASSLTGIPTVVGWVNHENIYRGDETVRYRVEDVNLVYTGTEGTRAEMLQKYDVQYVYVGPEARDRYANSNLDFSKYQGIEEAFRSGNVVVYRVHQSELS